MKKKLLSLTFIVCLPLIATNANAESMLNAEQVKELVTGKTIQAKHNIKGFKFSVYFDKDNKTAFRKQKGSTTKTSYMIKGNKHCLQWKGQNHCANIRDNKDGTWSRINPKGKAIITWSNITDGKKL